MSGRCGASPSPHLGTGRVVALGRGPRGRRRLPIPGFDDSAARSSGTLSNLPSDLDALRRVVQGLLLHRDWAPRYGVAGEAIRIEEENLRSTSEVLERVFDLSGESVIVVREPIDRVLCICRHFTLLHTALLRRQGVPARVRCGLSSYFDPTKWFDHWITERWNGQRWVRDDPQIDELQADVVNLDFDPYDQPPGKFRDSRGPRRRRRTRLQ